MSIDWLPPEKQPGAEGWCSTHRAWPLGATEGTHNFGFYRVLHSIQVRQVFFDHAVIHWRNRSCSQQQLPRWPETCATSDRKGAEPCRFWCCACQSDFALTMNWKWLDSQPVYVKFFGSHPSNILDILLHLPVCDCTPSVMWCRGSKGFGWLSFVGRMELTQSCCAWSIKGAWRFFTVLTVKYRMG